MFISVTIYYFFLLTLLRQSKVGQCLTGNGLTSSLSKNLTDQNGNNQLNVTSDLIKVFNDDTKLIQRQDKTGWQLSSDRRPRNLIKLNAVSTLLGKSDRINSSNSNYTSDLNPMLDYHAAARFSSASLSQRFNESAIVEDIFNKIRSQDQFVDKLYSNQTKQIDLAEDESPQQEPIINDASVEYDDNWSLINQYDSEDKYGTDGTFNTSTLSSPSTESTSDPTLNVSLSDNEKKEIPIKMIDKEQLFAVPYQAGWSNYYKKRVNAELSKLGTSETEAKVQKTNRLIIKSDPVNNLPSTTADQSLLLSKYPIFDDHLNKASPYYNYLANQVSDYHVRRPSICPIFNLHRFKSIQSHRVPYLPFHYHHNVHRYPKKLKPIAFSCCQVFYPHWFGKRSLGNHNLLTHGSKVSTKIVPTLSSTPVEINYKVNHKAGANCIPVYYLTGYPFGYGHRCCTKWYPFALKLLKKTFFG